MKVKWHCLCLHAFPPFSSFIGTGKQMLDLHVCLSVACADDGQEKSNDDAPENNPQYTTVYVGNLAPEARKLFWTCCLWHIIISSIYILGEVIYII